MKTLRSFFLLLAATCALSLSAATSEAPQSGTKDGSIAVIPVPAGMITLPSGVKYVVTKVGTGAAIRVGQTVYFYEAGYSLEGKSLGGRASGDPYWGTLGQHYVRPAELEEVFSMLHIGDRATVTVPSDPGIRYEVEMVDVKKFNLGTVLREVIDSQGLEAARRRFSELKATKFPDCYVGAGDLASLAYAYLADYPRDRSPEALAVLEWTTELYPEYAYAWAVLAYYQVRAGNRDLAIGNYEKAVRLDPANKYWSVALADLKTNSGALARMQTESRLGREINGVYGAAVKGDTTDLPALRAHLSSYLEQYPDAAVGETMVRNYLKFASMVDTKLALADARAFLNSPHQKAREVAQEKLRSLESLASPLDLKFTAVDGRAVDLAQLRGKVVLVDFWATWCGPCKAELPNVIANYQKFHDKGFEVVGIALEDGKLTPKDTPEQTSAKMEKAKKVLTDFTADHAMPWPQYFDGKYWKNDISTKFNIQGIPAMFLLDQGGKVVSTNARGEALEKEVKRLLKL